MRVLFAGNFRTKKGELLMTISGVSSNAYLSYTGYCNSTTSNYSSIQSATELTTQTQGLSGQQDAPPPPPPPPPPSKDSNSSNSMSTSLDLDTDDDGVWSAEELDEFASYASSTLGLQIDTESILNTYDTDGDGSISSTEEVSMAEDNAFGLPSPQEMMQQMRGFSQPPQIQSVDPTSLFESDSNDDTSSLLIEQFLNNYNQQNKNLYSELFATSSTYEL